MTDLYYRDDAGPSDVDDRVPMGVWMNWAGALVSFALIAGLVVWGYQLLVRDVTGVPVVRALEGPMRVAPADPGGQQADYQDLSVTRVAAEGAEETPAERVVLAPAPVELADEDQPVAALIPDTPSATPETVARAEERPRSVIELAIAEALGITPENIPDADDEARAIPAAFGGDEDDAAPPVPVNAGGVVSSPRPVARPARAVRPQSQLVPRITNAVAVTSASAGLDVDISEIAPGTRLVQLGAYPSIEGAREAWDALDASFGDFLEGKRRVVQEATAGGSTFYRLRAMGFADLNDARRFCAVLVAENANCIPVIRR